MKPVKIMVVFGTRPEAIKLAPIIRKAKERKDQFETTVVATAQHREMLDSVLECFGIQPDIDLNIMKPGQSLYYITSKIFAGLEKAFEQNRPDMALVQGDTTTTFAGAMAGYYARTKIGHVEAGLRTGDKWSPFPEEMNRKMTSVLADHHFAPTETAAENLAREGYSRDIITVTGNTVIDALLWMVKRVENRECPVKEIDSELKKYDRMVLITGHRRENFGDSMNRICRAFRKIAEKHPDVCFVYPVHPNPNVQKPVREKLENIKNFFLLPPLTYPHFIWFMQKSYMIITDSGGIQEEAPGLKKPLLVTRKFTERKEGEKAGVLKLVGDDEKMIVEYTGKLLEDEEFYSKMASGASPYGDGAAADRILDKILEIV